MESRSQESEMVRLADRLADEMTSYFREFNASTDFGVETPFLVLIFGFVAAIYADKYLIDDEEHDLFLQRAADYIVVQGLGTRRRRILLTTPEYRERLRHIDALLKYTNKWVDEILLTHPEMDDFEDYVLEDVCEFAMKFNEHASSLKVPTVDDSRRYFIARSFADLLRQFHPGELL